MVSNHKTFAQTGIKSPQKKNIFLPSRIFLYQCYYPHGLRYALSPLFEENKVPICCIGLLLVDFSKTQIGNRCYIQSSTGLHVGLLSKWGWWEFTGIWYSMNVFLFHKLFSHIYMKQACCAGCRADPSRCNSTSRQNTPIQHNRRNFWTNTAI